jgi:hypothetical protein
LVGRHSGALRCRVIVGDLHLFQAIHGKSFAVNGASEAAGWTRLPKQTMITELLNINALLH